MPFLENMSEFNITWRRYGLKDNPYFNAPLTIEGGAIPITSFIGRKKERQELKRVIEMGSDIRFIITGEAGVGKTSLLNFIKHEASKEQFFTPSREIEINKVISGNELIINTLSVIYDEVKKRNVSLREDLRSKLEAIYELTKYGELSYDVANITQLNKQRLIDLFREVVGNIVHPRFKSIIIHYDNLDNVDDFDGLSDLLSDVRDFLLTKNVVFIFVGDTFLPLIVNSKKRVGQIFITPPLEVSSFSYDDIKAILEERVNQLRIDESLPIVIPHTEESIKLLFNLHKGNIREILNSLISCILSLQQSNVPIQITEDILRDILFKKVNEGYIKKLTTVEKEILLEMIDRDYITPTELSKLTKKSVQNISSKYLPKLIMIGTVRLKNIEGRNKYYEITPEIKWWKLRRSEQEKMLSRMKIEKKINDLLQKSLKDFL